MFWDSIAVLVPAAIDCTADSEVVVAVRLAFSAAAEEMVEAILVDRVALVLPKATALAVIVERAWVSDWFTEDSEDCRDVVAVFSCRDSAEVDS